MTDYKLELPPCTSFCQNSDNSNGICRACLEREKTTHGILLNIAKRMTADNFVDYPQWLFTLIEEAIKLGTAAPHPQTVDLDALKRDINNWKYDLEREGKTVYPDDLIDHLAARFDFVEKEKV